MKIKQNKMILGIAVIVLTAAFIIPFAEDTGAFSWSAITQASPQITGASSLGYCTGTAKSCTSFSSYSCAYQMGCSPSRFGCYGTATPCSSLTIESNCKNQKGCLWNSMKCDDSCTQKTVTLHADHQIAFCCNLIKLEDVSTGPVIIDVDGVTETVTGTEDVNGVKILVKKTSYAPNTADRSATLILGSSATEITMKVGDATTYSGKKITLKNVGSAGDLATIKILNNFGSASKSIKKSEVVSGINIKVTEIGNYENKADRYATLDLSTS